MRATLRAFHRRAGFVLAAAARTGPSSVHYVEIGPAYVLATARMSAEPVTRYAVEHHAWPTLRAILGWEELSTSDARSRRALLRRLIPGGRYGRHVFVAHHALTALLHAAEDLIADTEIDVNGQHIRQDTSQTDWHALRVEALVELRRRPQPGLRSVAAHCPRADAHAHGDQNPSLVLWMNADGLTGGALCPVCQETDDEAVPRNVTWRVHYLRNNVAALCTPLHRIRRPDHVLRHADMLRKADLDKRNASDARVAALALRARPTAAPIATDDAKRSAPLGGCVLRDENRIAQIGHTMSMAYVTASLKISPDDSPNGFDGRGTKLRTVGSMAKLKCPMQIILWSERRSRGPASARRVEDVAWLARSTGTTAMQPEEWLPTSVVSVSAMRPSAWREVLGTNGRTVSVPASWEAAVQSWILFDLDDMQLQGDGIVDAAVARMSSVLRRNGELSGRCLIMQTGPNGLHVWAELREAREDARTWFKKDEVRAWYSKIGDKLLGAAKKGGASGGIVDMSSCSAGRFARRPGWRLLKDGDVFRSHVVMYVPGRVKSRKPRLD